MIPLTILRVPLITHESIVFFPFFGFAMALNRFQRTSSTLTSRTLILDFLTGLHSVHPISIRKPLHRHHAIPSLQNPEFHDITTPNLKTSTKTLKNENFQILAIWTELQSNTQDSSYCDVNSKTSRFETCKARKLWFICRNSPETTRTTWVAVTNGLKFTAWVAFQREWVSSRVWILLWVSEWWFLWTKTKLARQGELAQVWLWPAGHCDSAKIYSQHGAALRGSRSPQGPNDSSSSPGVLYVTVYVYNYGIYTVYYR
jgi:hypothetical protein